MVMPVASPDDNPPEAWTQHMAMSGDKGKECLQQSEFFLAGVGFESGKEWFELTFGTACERISDESLTLSDSGFVHRNIWF